MGMGFGANFVVAIQEVDVARIVGKPLMKKYNEALDALEAAGGGRDEFARDIFYSMAGDSLDKGIPEQVKAHDEALALYEKIRSVFQKKTGIELLLGFHDQEEEGDRYDDISGAFWHLDFTDCFPASKQFTALRKKCKKRIGINHFVTFG